jgi:neutral ceramidase
MLKKSNFILYCLLLFGSFAFGQNSDKNSEEKSTLFAGVSKVNITPKTPIPIAWHAGQNMVYERIHDEVFIRAIVFSDGKTKAVLITADASEFSNTFDDEVLNKIEKETGIPKINILISATNTHSGPTNIYSGMDYTKSTLQEVITYSDSLKGKIVEAVIEADKKLKPASIGTGRGQCKMNINRRAPLSPNGYPWLGKNPDGSCDHEVIVLRINDANGNVMGVYVNWPCQAAVMGPSSNQLTGDWPGATALFLEKEFGNNVVALVTAGASADIDPVFGPLGTSFGISSTSSDSYGYILGNEVNRVLKDIRTSPTGDISSSRKSVKLPGKLSTRDIPGITFEETMNLKPGTFTPGPNIEIRVSAIKVGNTVFAGITGDVFHEIGLKIKEMSPYKNTFVVTHSNGWCGYIVTDKAYVEGGYEVVSSRIMSGGEKAVIENLLDMIDKL